MTIKDGISPTVKVDARLLGDGTLWIKTDKIDDIGRVIVEDGKTSCKQFYQDAQPEPCEDAVSQQAAIEGLPPAQPTISKIEKVGDAISRQAAIDAIETIGYDFSESGLSQTELEEVAEAIGEVRQDFTRILRRLPPVQPERAKGHWVIKEYEYFTCSECDFYYWNGCDSTEEAYERLWSGDVPKFCPNCGADMSEATEWACTTRIYAENP